MPTLSDASLYHARKRRRKKQNQKDFDIAGYFATPFNFGAALAGAASANSLVLPADIKIGFESTVALAAGDFGVENVSDGISYFSAEAAGAGAVINMRQLFRESKTIRILRGATAPAASITIYFVGPKSERVQIGAVTFT